MRILYVTDGSNGALAGARLLCSLPLNTDARITILTVLRHEPEAETALVAAQEALRHCTAGLETRIRHGYPAEEILREAEERPTDLIVVGSRGRSPIARFFLGSVAERVVRHAACPVLVARPLDGELRKMIVGVDGSEWAARALDWVRQLPLPPDCQVRLVMVLPFLEDLIRTRMFTPPYPAGILEANNYAEQQRKEAQEQLDQLTAGLRATGKQADSEIRHGEPAPDLLDAAQEWSADLIVVGSQGLSAIERFMMGSVSENVVRHARCSVLVVKPHGVPSTGSI
jgi:nucleotide-binding universal stress UspA family protein